jgi:hypothetical protein
MFPKYLNSDTPSNSLFPIRHKFIYSSYKVSVIPVKFKKDFSFLDRLSKNIQIQNSLKILSVGAALFHADGQRETNRHDAANSRFTQCNKSA